MTSRTLRISSLKFIALLFGAAGVVCAYTLPAFKELAARSAYQHFIGMTAEKTGETMTAEQFDRAAAMLDRARQYERSNPRWQAERGNFLHNAAAGSLQRDAVYQTAESDLKQAILLDPTNGWNFYELGRLRISMGDACGDEWKNCAPTHYFLTAWQTNPNTLALRARLALWLYHRDRTQALQLIRDALPLAAASTKVVLEDLWLLIQDYHELKAFLPESDTIAFEFSRFLFEKHLDYYSDIEATSACASPEISAKAPQWCRASQLDQAAIQNGCADLPVLARSPDGRSLELGFDDGSEEWGGYMTWEGFRLKKLFCLPANIEEYDYAAIKILMKATGSSNFIVDISLDETLAHRYEKTAPEYTGWYEIPFHPSLLSGKSHVAVYIRVKEASLRWKKFLVVWGDQHSARTYSTLALINRGAVDDLSPELEGEQSGEYLIRLVFKKSSP